MQQLYIAYVLNLASGDADTTPPHNADACENLLNEFVYQCTGESKTLVVRQYMEHAKGDTQFTLETGDDIFVFGIVRASK